LDCFGTEKVEVEKIIKLIRANFDLSPNGIIEKLDLKNVKYLPTATY
jgi:S-adenosylmethionine synthetase